MLDTAKLTAAVETPVAPKLNTREKAALDSLATRYGSDFDCIYIRTVANETGLTEQQARRAVRSLARKGLAEYVRGLFSDDGRVAGSGYRCTREGRIAATLGITPDGRVIETVEG